MIQMVSQTPLCWVNSCVSMDVAWKSTSYQENTILGLHIGKLVFQSRWPVNIHRLNIQLKNVCSHTHQRANVWLGSPEVSVDELFDVRPSLSLEMEAKMMLVHVVRLHGVDDTRSHSQWPAVQDPERGFLVDLEVLYII